MERLASPCLPRARLRVYALKHPMRRRASTSRFGWLFALAAAFGGGLLVASPLAHVLTHSLQGEHTHLANGQVIYHRDASPSEQEHQVREPASPGARHERDHEPPRPATDIEPTPQLPSEPEAAPESPGQGEGSSGGHTDESAAHFTLFTFASASFVPSVARLPARIEPPLPAPRDASSFQFELAAAPRGPPSAA